MTVFEEIKSAVDMRSVAEMYGFKVNHGGMVLCPFHDEKTPSAKIYDGNGSRTSAFHCFGCGVHTDVIDFTQRLFNLDKPIEAVMKLNADFGLNVGTENFSDRHKKSEYEIRVQERKKYSEWEQSAWETLCCYLRLMRAWSEITPCSPDKPLDSRFVYAMHHLDYAEYLHERFLELPYDKRSKMKAVISAAADFLMRGYSQVISDECRSVMCGHALD